MSRQPRHDRKSFVPTSGQIRIIGGVWRSRRIRFPDVDGLRPTGDRVRETLFNWLAPVVSGSRCLDLFAGSGALGLEALSRGASSCLFLEKHPAALHCIRENIGLLEAGSAAVEHADAVRWCELAATGCFDIVFMDPPFADQSIEPHILLAGLVERSCLASSAWAYIEQPATVPLPALKGWTLYRELVAGAVRSSLWRRSGNDSSTG